MKSDQKKLLIKMARYAIEDHLSGKERTVIRTDNPLMNEKRGAFVTLKHNGRLRGCIGRVEPVSPLHITVMEMAANAATEDPRFEPLTLPELPEIDIEISVLTVPQKAGSPNEIEMGRDGVIVTKGWKKGVLLPQVADETGWSREDFLSYLCKYKAGLREDAWKDPSTTIETFRAEVFSEKDIESG